MAYAALVSLLHITDQFLDLGLCFFPFTREKIESFRETVDSLVAFLDKCPPICSQQVHDLIAEIRDASYEAEDVLESLIATHFLQKDGSDGYRRLKRFHDISFEQIVEKLETIDTEVRKIQLDGSEVHERRISDLSGSSRPALRRYDTNLMALDNDLKMKLMEQLVAGRSIIDVIPIAGMGGIGKTTLARILYDSRMVKESFDIRGWVTVSQTYKAQEVVLDILKDMGVPLDRKKDVEQQLYQTLYIRKYLIVLDDVWDTHAWDDIKRLLPENENGSRIILTTRHSKVAAYANSSGTYTEMQLLDEDSSWSLLCREIFPDQNFPSDLVEIGKEIARQCQGLPLAISAIGGHLKKEKHTKKYWEYISGNVNSVLKTTNDPSLEILTLSYNYLPHHLKACFLYFGFVQKDRPVEVFRIVNLWIAEGFVKPSRLDNMEQVAEEYLRDMIERNLVLVRKCDSFGKPKRCGIHDLFRDICIREAQKEKFFHILNMDKWDEHLDLMEINSRRLGIESDESLSMDGSLTVRCYYDDDLIFWNESDSSNCGVRDDSEESLGDDSEESDADIEYDGDMLASNRTPTNYNEYRCKMRWAMSAIRSFICHFDFGHTSSAITKLPSGMLKVLNIRMKSTKFPMEIFEFISLKYLHLGNLREIPSSISRLRNLQTLIVRSMYIKSMPSEIWEMRQLRHLLIGGFHLLDVADVQGKGANAYVLKSLQTLSEVIDLACTQEVLARIPNLKELKLLYSRDVVGWSFHCLNNLVYLRKLESLRMDFWPHDCNLRNLAFPFSLKELVLVGSRIPWEQMTIIGMLPNLEVLKLKNRATKGKLWETNDGEFKELKFLMIELSVLVEWKTERDHFPSLQHLSLQHCYLLEAIPSEVGEIPTLEIIEINGCSQAAESSAKEMLGEDSDIKLIISNEETGNYSVTSRYLLDFIAQSLCESIKESCCCIIL